MELTLNMLLNYDTQKIGTMQKFGKFSSGTIQKIDLLKKFVELTLNTLFNFDTQQIETMQKFGNFSKRYHSKNRF
jgi:hypothetical protein